jgi:hypothetical protein
MFAYNPQVTDRSGELLAAGQVGAAQTNAQMMQGLGENIGGALASIGEIYGKVEERKAKGRSFKKTLEVMGPALGMTTATLKAAFGDVKSDFDYANLSDTLTPLLPAWINSTLGYGRLGVQQRQPYVNAGLQNAGNLAAGEGTVPLPNNPAPYGGPVVEPPFPEGDPAGAETLPPVRTSTPSPDAMSAADSWRKNKSSGGPMQSGSMKPFWRR